MHGMEDEPRLEFERLETADSARFDSLVAMYADAFPASERKSTAALRGMLQEEQYAFFLALRSGVVGFAIVRSLCGGSAALLEYMAVSPDLRGNGVGAQMVAAMAREYAPLLIELESDRDGEEDREARSRRKQFYRRQGAREIAGLQWMMPPVHAATPPPMEMMAIGVAGETVSRETLRVWLTGIYVEVYGQSVEDARIEAMLSVLPHTIKVV